MRWLLTLLLLPLSAHAGPWTRGPGEVYAKVSEGAFLARAFRDGEGRLQTGVEYLGLTSALYLELGLLDHLHLQVYLPHIAAINTFDMTGDRYLSAGGGDAQLGLQVGLPVPFPAAVRLVLKAPMYDVGGIGGRQEAYFPQRGDGQIDISAVVSAGYGIGQVYFFGEVGHQARTERFTGVGGDAVFEDGLLWSAQVGWTVGRGLSLAVGAGGVVPYADDRLTKAYTQVGPSLYAPIAGPWALEAGYDRIVRAVNSAEGEAFNLGLSYNLQ